MIDRSFLRRKAPPPRPLSGFDDEIAPEMERKLADLARAAQAGDRAARDALWEALAPAIGRQVGAARRRARFAAAAGGARRDGMLWEGEDLAQEAFLIFVDLLDAWPGDRPVGPYLLGYLPWRLRSVWRVLVARQRVEGAPLPARVRYLADDSAAAEEVVVLLERVAGGLSPLDGRILLGHVRDGEPLTRVARDLGLDRRTVQRRWRAIKEGLRRE